MCRSVVNASFRQLSDVEIEALALGPNYVPWSRPDFNQTQVEHKQLQQAAVGAWIQRVNTAAHFLDPMTTTTHRLTGHLASSRLLMKHKQQQGGGWKAPERAWTADPEASRLLGQLTRVAYYHHPNARASTSRKRHQQPDDAAIVNALESLRLDPSIRLCVADKGLALIVWCRSAYVLQGVRHLEETDSNYTRFNSSTELESHLNFAVRQRFHLTELLVANNHITKAEWSAITQHEAQPSPIRFRPKTHKPLCALTGTYMIRPIVATNRAVTRPIDKYMAAVVHPLMDKIPFSCNSTDQVLDRILSYNRNVTRNTTPPLLIKADIVSLFPSIQWQAAVEATATFYAEWYPWLVNHYRTTNRLPPPTVPLFKDLLVFILRHSFIYFGETDVSYWQKSGIAMGSCISTFVANCTVWAAMRTPTRRLDLPWPLVLPVDDDEDERAYYLHKKKQTQTSNIKLLCRYVDDFFFITTETRAVRDLLNQFHANSNNHLSFTTETAAPGEKLVFLDLQLHIDPLTHQVHSTAAVKETNHYTHRRSCHSPTVLDNLPQTQLSRVARSCLSLDSGPVAKARFRKAARMVYNRFRLRGYPLKMLKTAAQRALDVATSKPYHTNAKPHEQQQENQQQQFRFVRQFNGQTKRHHRLTNALLNRVLRRAAAFYRNQGPAAERIASMLSTSRASITYTTASSLKIE